LGKDTKKLKAGLRLRNTGGAASRSIWFSAIKQKHWDPEVVGVRYF